VNPMGMGIKHRIGNGNGMEWETTSVRMGITCTPIGIYSQRFYAAMNLGMGISQKLGNGGGREWELNRWELEGMGMLKAIPAYL